MVKKHGRFGGLPCRGARPVRDPPTLRSAAAAVPHALLHGDPPNLVADMLREPEVAIGPGRDALRRAPERGKRERGDAATGGKGLAKIKLFQR